MKLLQTDHDKIANSLFDNEWGESVIWAGDSLIHQRAIQYIHRCQFISILLLSSYLISNFLWSSGMILFCLSLIKR